MTLILIINGQQQLASDVIEELPRAVLISLFTWCHSDPDDILPANINNGWWGDAFNENANDKIGSKLWLLGREKITNKTPHLIKFYAHESLKWLVSDQVAIAVDVIASRSDIDAVSLDIRITRGDKSLLSIRFANVWDFMK